jgi:hypothetical protein
MKAHTLLVRNLGTLGCALAFVAGTFTLPGCSGVKGGGAATGGGGGGTGSSGNSVPIAVNTGPAMNNLNIPLVTVNICVPGTSNCQMVPNVLVDTGSVGLRILGTQVSIPILKATDTNGNPLGECVTFADGTFLWGSVQTADITLAGEKASAVPIQIILTTGSVGFPLVPNNCSNSAPMGDAGNVSALHANGILGVGLFKQDCGPACAAMPPANFYYDAGASCVQTSCANIAVPLLNQLQNPVSLFTTDNNGVLISMTAVGATGAATDAGTLIFGIGTQSNNGLGTAKVYTTDSFGFFTATYNTVSYPQSFVDSGSNGYFFLDAVTSGLTACAPPNGFYCPASSTNFTVTNTGNNGTTAPVMFSIVDFATIFSANPGFTAFSNIGGPFSGAFDYGLPFFYGRPVFTGIEGQTSPGGTGPYFAY